MSVILVIVFLILAVLFFMLEIFFLPGISIGGIVGAIFAALAIWYAFAYISSFAGWITVVLGLILFVVALLIFLKGRVLDKVSLHATLSSTPLPFTKDQVCVGDRAVSLSRLAPMGTISINGLELEAKSISGFIDPQTIVEVVDIDSSSIVVSPIQDADSLT